MKLSTSQSIQPLFQLTFKKDIKYIEERLNHRPRKSLGWRTPYEVFHEKEAA